MIGRLIVIAAALLDAASPSAPVGVHPAAITYFRCPDKEAPTRREPLGA